MNVTVNNRPVHVDDNDNRTLLAFLRETLGLKGTKNGCGVGECGTCTVLVDGVTQRACRVTLGGLGGKTVETIESLFPGETMPLKESVTTLHPIQQAMLASGAVQCGFCTPGMIMAIKGLIARNQNPDEVEIRRALRGNLCRCTGYQAIVDAVKRVVRDQAGDPSALDPSPDAPVPRMEGVAKVTGTLPYADDLARPDMLYGAFLFSEHTHAEILGIDTSACGEDDAVVLVLTAEDIPGRNGFGLHIPHQPVFAAHRVRYPGEVIACAVAETEVAARAAVKQIAVTYRPLPPLRDPEENMRSDAPLLHPEGNVAEHVEFTRGDPDRAFLEADLVIEGEYRVPAIEHAYLEPEACLAVPDEDGFRVTVYGATQGAHAFREMIAASLDLPEETVRMAQTMPGGGFGGKEEPTVHIQAALAAIRTGRPVKIALNRAESIRISTKRHGAVIRMSHAVRADGTLLGVRSRSLCDAGAYLSLTRPVVFRTVVCAAGPYAIPNVRAEGFGVYTTTNPAGAFRGFGSTQVAFASERQMDKIARTLGMDPFELRRKNGLEAGKRTITGQQIRTDGTGYMATLDAVERALEDERDTLLRAPLDAGWIRAIGIASSYKNVGLGKGLPDTATAEVELTREGRLIVRVGATDMGQGSDTIMAQIAVRAFGTEYGNVDIISSDTAQCPDGGMTTASRQTFITGNAVRLAAEKLAARLRDVPTESPAEVGKRSERVTYRPPATSPLVSDDGPGTDGDIHFSFCYTTGAVILAVHPESGRIKVERIIAAADAGTAIHLQNVKGQIEGGVAMGLGYGLSERYVHEENHIVTDTLTKLGISRADTVPPISTVVIEIPDNNGPFGAKGLGEIPLNPVAPAIANALASVLNKEFDVLPILPERIIDRNT